MSALLPARSGEDGMWLTEGWLATAAGACVGAGTPVRQARGADAGRAIAGFSVLDDRPGLP